MQIQNCIKVRARQIVLVCWFVAMMAVVLASGQPVAYATARNITGGPTSSASDMFWQIQCVDCPVNNPEMGSRNLRLDAIGHPHLVFGADHLYYARNNNNTWQIEVVDYSPRVGSYASLALDSNGHPHISYMDSLNRNLKYATWDGHAWKIQVVDKEWDTGWFTSVALDSQDRPYISYIRFGTPALKYANWTDTSWIIRDVESGTPGITSCYPSLALDKNDQPHLSYCSDDKLKYGQLEADAWTSRPIDNYIHGTTSLVLDSAGQPHIAYLTQGSSAVNYALWNGDSWKIQTVDTGYFLSDSISMNLDQSNRPSISYWHANGGLSYAQRNGDHWGAIVVVADPGGSPTSLVLDNVGDPHISYLSLVSGEPSPSYTHWNGVIWESQIVSQAVDAGGYTSLALDNHNNPHISYRAQSAVRYAWWNGRSWLIEKVDNTREGCSDTSLALDHTGQPYIAYCARDYSGQFCLKLAHRINATWDIQCAIVGTNYAGMADVSLALDSSDQPHISYIDMATSSIEYVRRTEVGWQSYTVDDTTTIDARTSTLALDRLGQPHISYYHGGDRVFKHAQPDLDAWLTQPVDQGWLVGLYPSLAIGQDGVFHVSYHDAVNSSSDLKYAHRGTDVWDVQIVDSVGRVGMFSSLVLNGFGQPVISYYDETRGDLKVANKRAGAWNTNAVDQDGNVGLYTSLAVDNQGRFHISYYDKTNGDLKYAIGLPLASRTYLPIIRR